MMKTSTSSWSQDGVLNVASRTYRARKTELETVCALLEKLSASRMQTQAGLQQFFTLIDWGRDLVETLLTACHASQTLMSHNTTVSAEGHALHEILSWLKVLEDQGTKALSQVASNEKISDSSLSSKLKESDSARKDAFGSEYQRQILGPIYNLYPHLKASMHIRIENADGTLSKPISFSTAESLLRASDDGALRKKVHSTFNAWMADNAILFVDILNAVSGYRAIVFRRLGIDSEEYSLQQEKLGHRAFENLHQAVLQQAEHSRKAIELMAAFLYERQAANLAAKLPVYYLMAPLPHGKIPSCIQSFSSTIETVRQALRSFFPQIDEFIDMELQGRWIEARNSPGGVSGSWCASAPTEKAVAIFADYQPSISRAFELAHILGEAALRWLLQSNNRHRNGISLTACETAVRFFSVALGHHLLNTLTDREELIAVVWQMMRDITSNLLHLPFRYELSCEIQKTRAVRELKVEDLNHLTQQAWKKYFADSVQGVDQYVWIHKVHFYLPETVHYDFQYTYGFLVANVILHHLVDSKTNGSEIPDSRLAEYFLEASDLDCEELMQKHFGLDISQASFWQDAIKKALAPIQKASAWMRSDV